MNFFEIISKTHLIDPNGPVECGGLPIFGVSPFHPFHRRSIFEVEQSCSSWDIDVKLSVRDLGLNGIGAWIKTSINKTPRMYHTYFNHVMYYVMVNFWTLTKKKSKPIFYEAVSCFIRSFWGDVSQFCDVQIQEIYSSLRSEAVLKKILLSRLSDSWRSLNVYVDVSP